MSSLECNTLTHDATQSIADVFDAVTNGSVRYGVVPIEDTATGSVPETYDLLLQHDVTIIGESIECESRNYTRFIVISKPMEMVRPQSTQYKRTIAFRIPNEPGGMCRALLPFAMRGVDIAKIET